LHSQAYLTGQRDPASSGEVVDGGRDWSQFWQKSGKASEQKITFL
jgi:hypothetical protein